MHTWSFFLHRCDRQTDRPPQDEEIPVMLPTHYPLPPPLYCALYSTKCAVLHFLSYRSVTRKKSPNVRGRVAECLDAPRNTVDFWGRVCVGAAERLQAAVGGRGAWHPNDDLDGERPEENHRRGWGREQHRNLL